MAVDGLVPEIRSALTTVEDPELGLDIVSLGLVYGIERDGGHGRVVYSLTSRGCAIGQMDVEAVEVELVFDPRWSPERMSDDAKFLLGVYGYCP
jgi:metal-sulfur cluster biosynthetic enzyme